MAPASCAKADHLAAARHSSRTAFSIRKDGLWALNLTVFTLLEKEVNEKFFFNNLPALVTLIDQLAGKPFALEDKLPADKSCAEVLAALQSTASNLTSRLRHAKGSKMER